MPVFRLFGYTFFGVFLALFHIIQTVYCVLVDHDVIHLSTPQK